jgi:mRNA interferase RelE/StbE
MRIIIKPAFKRDTDRVANLILLNALTEKIGQIEKANGKENITGLKLLRGYSTQYRIYVKAPKYSYRIGAVIRDNTIWLVRFLPRKFIYRKFP